MYRGYYESPIGLIEVTADDTRLLSVIFVEEKQTTNENNCVKEGLLQLSRYFKGEMTDLHSSSLATGTPFQHTVWKALTQIPFGTTYTYSEIAQQLQKESAVRAVGNAIGKTRFAILVPCHRVLGKNGTMTGFAWGTWRKEWLLAHEKNHSQQ